MQQCALEYALSRACAAVYVNKAQAAANPEMLEQLISAKLEELQVCGVYVVCMLQLQ